MNTAQWTPEQRELWARLENFDWDESGASLDFSRRLARENGWTYAFSRRVVEEYKRFLFLAMCAGHPVTPSDEVDQAWHLHLVYTRSYWNELCAEVLRRPLHHGPTRGGAQEGVKFGEWYAKTRASYARFFGEATPEDIWPDASIRFGEAPHFRRVNARRSWIIEKPKLTNLQQPRRLSPAFLIALMVLGAGGVAVGAQVNLNPWNWGGTAFLTLFWIACAVGIVAILWARNTLATPNDSQLPSVPVDAYAIARLRAGNQLPIDAAIIHMIAENRIAFDDRNELIRTGAAPTHPFERAIWDAIGQGVTDTAKLRSFIGPRCESFDKELRDLGLLISEDARTNISLVYAFVPMLLLLLGGSKILVGLSRDRPVGFLVASCVIVFIAAFFVWGNFPKRSGRGEALLNHLQRQHGRGSLSLPSVAGESSWTTGAGLAGGAALAVALYGYDELDAFGMSGFREQLQPAKTKGDGSSGCSSSGCGSNSGSGGGDSGCGGGGCGGCGGG